MELIPAVYITKDPFLCNGTVYIYCIKATRDLLLMVIG